MLRLVLEPTGPFPSSVRAAQPARTGPGAGAVVPPLGSPDPLLTLPGGPVLPQRLTQLSDTLAGAGDDVLVLAADAVLPEGAIRLVVGAPGPAVLTRRGARSHPVATSGAHVLTAATALHAVEGADADGVGALFLPAAQLPAAAGALTGAAESAREQSWPALDLFDLVLGAVVRGGLAVAAVPVEPFPGGRPADATEAEVLAAAVAGADEAELASRRSSRRDDGFYSTFVLRRLSRPISRWGAAHGVSPNAVTILSGVLGIAAAVAFGDGRWAGLLAGAVLLQVSLVLDCVDGEIARTTGRFSAFGAWLDASLDRVKEYGSLAGLAVGADRQGHDLWLVAAAAMVVQTARHVQDFGFDKGVLAAWRAPRVDRRPLSDRTPWTRPAGSAPPTAGTTSASEWARRVIHMPIAERWLVLSVGAALDRPAWSLVAYLGLTAIAAAYTLAGALLRSLRAAAPSPTAPHPTALGRVLARYRDDGLLGWVRRGRGWAPGGTAGWLVPVGVTALEGAVLVAAAGGLVGSGGHSARVWAFAWFAAVAWHRYDLIYRWRDRGLTVPAWADLAGGGWLVRTVVIAVAALTGGLTPVLALGTIWLTIVYVPESLVAGAQSWRGQPGASGITAAAPTSGGAA